jgi:hypothetical protein
MRPKQFLLQECKNVRSTLRDVLRHDYAAGSSEEFYNEFCERLDFLESLLDPVDPDDVTLLQTFADEVSLLSTLVHHIERSHAGEFPWSFTEYLQKIAIPLCKENLADNEGEPILRVYAEGGLYSYQINLENDLSVLNIGRRVFTIVFPRTLKHYVLLHAIFGHEIGHAAGTIPRHKAELRDKVLGPLRGAGPLTSVSQATLWLRNPSAPAAIQDLRNQYGDPSYTEINRNQLDSWFQEFMCDLFGLVTFGPSFLAAHQTLLLALDPTGHRWGPYHPPYICRKAMLWHACKHLKWDQFATTATESHLKEDMERFFKTYIGANAPGAWEDVFTPKQVEDAVDALIAFLTAAGSPCFSLPDQSTLASLIEMLRDEIPPCGSDLSGSPEPKNRAVDFRHILFAGWIVSEQPVTDAGAGTDTLDFLTLNKLCEMGMLQQRAIDLYDTKHKEAAA